MPISSVDYLHGIVNSSTFLSQFTSQQISPGMQALIAHAAGQVHPQFAANLGQVPFIRFTSPQVKTVLDLVNSGCIYDLSAGNTDLYFKAAADQGSRGASASNLHHRYRVAQGFLVMERLRAGHTVEAQVQATLWCNYDGTNAPIVYAGTVALAGTPTSAEHFLLGECHLNGSELDGPQDLDIDFGPELYQGGSAGELYNTFNCLQRTNPTIAIAMLNSGYWATAGLNGVDVSSGSLYLRKMARTGRVADATAQHIKWTLAAGLAYIQDTSGDGASPNLTNLMVKPIAASDTGFPITLTSTAVAMTN